MKGRDWWGTSDWHPERSRRGGAASGWRCPEEWGRIKAGRRPGEPSGFLERPGPGAAERQMRSSHRGLARKRAKGTRLCRLRRQRGLRRVAALPLDALGQGGGRRRREGPPGLAVMGDEVIADFFFSRGRRTPNYVALNDPARRAVGRGLFPAVVQRVGEQPLVVCTSFDEAAKFDGLLNGGSGHGWFR